MKRKNKKLSSYLKSKRIYFIYKYPYDIYSFMVCGRKYQFENFDIYNFFPSVCIVYDMNSSFCDIWAINDKDLENCQKLKADVP